MLSAIQVVSDYKNKYFRKREQNKKFDQDIHTKLKWTATPLESSGVVM